MIIVSYSAGNIVLDYRFLSIFAFLIRREVRKFCARICPFGMRESKTPELKTSRKIVRANSNTLTVAGYVKLKVINQCNYLIKNREAIYALKRFQQ